MSEEVQEPTKSSMPSRPGEHVSASTPPGAPFPPAPSLVPPKAPVAPGTTPSAPPTTPDADDDESDDTEDTGTKASLEERLERLEQRLYFLECARPTESLGGYVVRALQSFWHKRSDAVKPQ